MRWSGDNIDKIRIDCFLNAMGYDYAGAEKSFEIYTVPEVTVDGGHDVYANPYNNYWYGSRYGEPESEYGQLRDLIGKIIGSESVDLQEEYLRKVLKNIDPGLLIMPCLDIEARNRHKQLSVEMSRYRFETRREPTVVNIDIKHLPLTEFMKALGQEHPVYADGNLRIYNAPYDSPYKEPTMVVNVETNQWRDTKTGAYGGIYDLAYEMTGSCSMSDLKLYIATQMQPAPSPVQKQHPNNKIKF